MDSFFKVDGKLYATLALIANVAVVNILVILTALPLFSLGAALSAGHFVLIACLEEREKAVAVTFWREFRNNLRITWGYSLFFGVVITLALTQLWLLGNLEAENLVSSNTAMLMRAGILGVLTLVCLLTSWCFWLVAQFVNSLSGHLRNAALLLAQYPVISAINLGLALTPLIVVLWQGRISAELVLCYAFFGLGFTMYLQDLLRLKVRLKLLGQNSESAKKQETEDENLQHSP